MPSNMLFSSFASVLATSFAPSFCFATFLKDKQRTLLSTGSCMHVPRLKWSHAACYCVRSLGGKEQQWIHAS